MPMYAWRCTKCAAETEIIRSFDLYLDPPKTDELPDKLVVCALDDLGMHTWDKMVQSPKWIRGAGWSGSKGNW